MTEDTINNVDEFSVNPKKPQKIIKEEKINPERLERTVDLNSRKLDIAQKNLINVYKNEPKVPVRVAPAYAKYFGRVMRVAINGIIIAVRCDGETVELPESFATEVMKRMAEVDKTELRRQKMANVTKNVESSPGQINFFG
jgi:hypothetical protein